MIELGVGFDIDLSARERYLSLNGSLLGYTKNFIDDNFNRIVDFEEIHDFINMPLKNYSSGMVARIAFAITTIATTDILIVDEALSDGDCLFQEKCELRTKELVEKHGTILLFVSHRISQVKRICEKCLWLDIGEMRMVESAEEVCEAYKKIET